MEREDRKGTRKGKGKKGRGKKGGGGSKSPSGGGGGGGGMEVTLAEQRAIMAAQGPRDRSGLIPSGSSVPGPQPMLASSWLDRDGPTKPPADRRYGAETTTPITAGDDCNTNLSDAYKEGAAAFEKIQEAKR